MSKPRILFVEDYPFPAIPLMPSQWDADRVDFVWDVVETTPGVLDDMMLDKTKFQLGLRSGSIIGIDLLGGRGIILILGRFRERALVVCYLWAVDKAALRQYGGVKDIRKTVLEYLFSGGLRKLRCDLPKSSLGARRFAERCGFKLDGVLRNESVVGGEDVDVSVYSLLAQEM